LSAKITSTEAREKIVEAIELDLIGPTNDHAFAKELLPEAPTRWYLAGFLVPVDASEEDKFDPESQDQQDAAGEEPDSPDDSGQPDPTSGKTFLPSSMGISVLVPPNVGVLKVTVQWGDYIFEGDEESKEGAHEEEEDGQSEEVPKDRKGEDKPKTPEGNGSKQEVTKGFRRSPREEVVAVDVTKLGRQIATLPVPNSSGLEVAATLREVSSQAHLPKGTKSLSLFIVNRRVPQQNKRR